MDINDCEDLPQYVCAVNSPSFLPIQRCQNGFYESNICKCWCVLLQRPSHMSAELIKLKFNGWAA